VCGLGERPESRTGDTHALIGLASSPDKIKDQAIEQFSDPATGVWVSAASAWEIGVKTRLGRLDGDSLLGAWSEVLADMSMVAAQALRRSLTIATRDKHVLAAALSPTLEI
jgi:PIN domain nuclease of toxin-antitoxin system